MKRLLTAAAVFLLAVTSWADVYNVKDFGALPDGKTIASDAINAAINKAAECGGGMVYIPAGDYLCYSIRLKSNIHLYLEQGTRIIAAAPQQDRTLRSFFTVTVLTAPPLW